MGLSEKSSKNKNLECWEVILSNIVSWTSEKTYAYAMAWGETFSRNNKIWGFWLRELIFAVQYDLPN